MGFVIALLTGLDVLIAFCMIVLILMQQSKGGGGLGAIGGETTSSVFGAGTGNVLTKTTTILAAAFLAITLALAVITGHRKEGASVVESAANTVEQEAPSASNDAGEPSVPVEKDATDEQEKVDETAAQEEGESAAPSLQERDGEAPSAAVDENAEKSEDGEEKGAVGTAE